MKNGAPRSEDSAKRGRLLGSRCCAFTVIEMIAAMAIIAVLIVCATLGLSSARSVAQRAKCLNNMREVARSIMLYSSENDSRYPSAEGATWDIPLLSYWNKDSAKAEPILTCPADNRSPAVGGTHFPRSYSLNANLPDRAIAVQQPTATIMLAEWYTGEAGPGGASANYQYQPEYSLVEYHMAGLPIQYHKMVSNFVFCDGHAESYDPQATVLPRSFWTAQ